MTVLCMAVKGQTVPRAQVELSMSVGGKTVVIGTDSSWRWTPSTHTQYRWMWGGSAREDIDARRDIPDWCQVGCNEGTWEPVEALAGPFPVATAQSCPPNRVTRHIPAVACTSLGPDQWEVDFGANLTGWMRLRLPKLTAGHQVEVTIPVNTTATVYVPVAAKPGEDGPARDEGRVSEGNGPASKAEGVTFLRMEAGAAVYEVGSGSYRFGSVM